MLVLVMRSFESKPLEGAVRRQAVLAYEFSPLLVSGHGLFFSNPLERRHLMDAKTQSWMIKYASLALIVVIVTMIATN